LLDSFSFLVVEEKRERADARKEYRRVDFKRIFSLLRIQKFERRFYFAEDKSLFAFVLLSCEFE